MISVRKTDLKRPAFFRGIKAGRQLEREFIVRLLNKTADDFQRGPAFNYPKELRQLADQIASRE